MMSVRKIFLRPGIAALFAPVLISMIFTSCLQYKKVPYFKDLSLENDSMKIANSYTDPVIQRNDILKITVSSLDQEVTRLFSFNTDERVNNNAYSTGSNYLVDPEGMIRLPLIGSMMVAGSTTWAIRDSVTKKLEPFLKEIVVEIRISSFRISVIGDVASPGLYTISNERLTLPEALSMAGDLNITARRDNVLLIRDEGGQRKYYRFNLNEKDLFNAPYYYMKSNDVIYVQPGKIATRDINFRNLTYLATLLSLVAVIASIVK